MSGTAILGTGMDRSSAICLEFEPQKWRKSKCKHCFRDIELHVGFSSDGDNCYSEVDNSENKYKTADTASNLSNEQRKADLEEELDHEVRNNSFFLVLITNL